MSNSKAPQSMPDYTTVVSIDGVQVRVADATNLPVFTALMQAGEPVITQAINLGETDVLAFVIQFGWVLMTRDQFNLLIDIRKGEYRLTDQRDSSGESNLS